VSASVVDSTTSSMLIPVATTTLKLKDCGLNSIMVMVRYSKHAMERPQRPWIRGLQGEYLSSTHSNAMEGFIIGLIRPPRYFIDLRQARQNAAK